MSQGTNPTPGNRRGSTIHLVEPTGHAGVFQHAHRLGRELAASGHDVVLHTGHEHEDLGPTGMRLCACSWWPRRSRRGPARVAGIVLRYVGRTVPHLHACAARGSVVHVQGVAVGGALTLVMLTVARARGRRVVHSPHDTFSRRGSVDGLLLRRALRLAHAVVVHSRRDAAVVAGLGLRAYVSPLVQEVPPVDGAEVDRWRRRWGPGTVMLFAGFLRPEKRLDLLIEATAVGPGHLLAVVGPDRDGEWGALLDLARSRGVRVDAELGFAALPVFLAALAAADVVVVPSEVASQSGVLAVARVLGTPTVAAEVGGMGELACRTFDPGDAADLARAVDAVLTDPRPEGPSHAADAADAADAVRVHARAYGLSGAVGLV